MPRRVTVLLLAAISLLGALAPAASAASADPDRASCVAQFTSNQGPGEVGETISFLSHEAQPFGTTVVSMGAGLKPPCE
jgi:hypothetical protein